jgi:GNAT superfamily N-acetyltransferase
MMKIEILRAGDQAEWRPLWKAYLAFYNTALSDEIYALTFSRLINPDEDKMGGFIARDEAGKALGVAHWMDHRSCWTAGDYCYLQDLFVAGNGRRGGVATALIEAVAQAARARDCSRVYWITHETNLDAQKLYERVAERSGFIQFVRRLP